jgi:hypothetical protein
MERAEPRQPRGEPHAVALTKVLLTCGVLSSLLYAGADVLGAMRWEGYSYTSQSISELRAIGAPSRPLLVPLLTAYSLLVIGFGSGVWRSARGSAVRFMGALLIAFGVTDLVAPFVPMHVRGDETTLTDALHIALTGADVLFMVVVLAIGAGSAAFGKRFRLYSLATVLTVVGAGALAAFDGPRLTTQEPTPWIGITERICVGAFLLWVMLLGAVLRRAQRRGASTTTPVAERRSSAA